MLSKNWRKWYANSRIVIEQLFDNPDLFCDLLAATSPRKQVTANWRLAKRIYNNAIAGLPIPLGGMLPAHVKNVMRALWGLPLSGPKIKAFAANLKGDLQQITIDVWIERAYPELNHKQITHRIKTGARRLNMTPAEYQAIVWTKTRIKYGKRPISFNNVPGIFQKEFAF